MHGKEQTLVAETARIKEIYQKDINNIDDVYATLINEQPFIPSVSVGESTHEEREILYSWVQLHEIAKVISNNYGEEAEKINNNTEEVVVVVNGEQGTLGIGDWKMLNGKKVRILGFNHDTLANTNAYGGTNTYAGISFEFEECLITGRMNSSSTNTGGWGACELRETLNRTTVDSLDNKNYIKEIIKQYIETYNDAGSVTASQDKLWLLSCSEIWNSGDSGQPYGYAVAKEGERYKYYKNINVNSLNSDPGLVKKMNDSAVEWWLRSPFYAGDYFCNVYPQGGCSYHNIDVAGIAPGFCI